MPHGKKLATHWELALHGNFYRFGGQSACGIDLIRRIGMHANDKEPTMRISGTCILAMALLAIAGAVSADAVEASSSTSMTSSQTGSSSEASFTGNDGRHTVNGDVIEIRQGQLTVNGVPHGTVKPSSVIRYSVQDRQKTLMVDGQVRPLNK